MILLLCLVFLLTLILYNCTLFLVCLSICTYSFTFLSLIVFEVLHLVFHLYVLVFSLTVLLMCKCKSFACLSVT